MLGDMKVGERGQVTIPKEIRDRFGIGPDTEVEFTVERGEILLRKRAPRLRLRKWKGYCGPAFTDAGNTGVDEYIDEVRGKL
ncbi:MAG: AbrB/MazE/SpoVT family DNA-binding domain-containing protein [Bryobacterales bacterium]|nr:AbrB/MazE/SpoVT family DNA-binding domain-containing protein [Bryobacterales bacterium]